jgi:hypothetical protein
MMNNEELKGMQLNDFGTDEEICRKFHSTCLFHHFYRFTVNIKISALLSE